MSRNSVLIIISLVAVAFAGWRVYAILGGGMAPPTSYYYYDTVSGELMTAGASNVPPIVKGGNECVRAYVFTCDNCSEEARFVGFYEKYTPDVRAELASTSDPVAAMAAAANRGLLQSIDGEQWFPAGSEESLAILERLRCPDGTNAKPCLP